MHGAARWSESSWREWLKWLRIIRSNFWERQSTFTLFDSDGSLESSGSRCPVRKSTSVSESAERRQCCHWLRKMENFNITLELIRKKRKKSQQEGYYVLRLNRVGDWLFTDCTDKNGVTHCNRLSYNNLQIQGLTGGKPKSLVCFYRNCVECVSGSREGLCRAPGDCALRPSCCCTGGLVTRQLN